MRNRVSFGLLALVALGALVASCSGPRVAAGSLRGTVTDAIGLPVAGATVIATSRTVSTRVAQTDAAGRYVIDGLPADHYAMLFVFGDARAQVQDIAVAPGVTSASNAELDSGYEVITIKEHQPLAAAAHPSTPPGRI